MEKMKRNIEVKSKAMELKKVLEDEFKSNINVAWTSTTFIVDRYLNSFDYRRYHVKNIEELNPRDYINTIKYADRENKYELLTHSKIERILIGAFHGLDNVRVFGQDIDHDDLEDSIWTQDIDSIDFDAEEEILSFCVIEEFDKDNETFYVMDLNTGNITIAE